MCRIVFCTRASRGPSRGVRAQAVGLMNAEIFNVQQHSFMTTMSSRGCRSKCNQSILVLVFSWIFSLSSLPSPGLSRDASMSQSHIATYVHRGSVHATTLPFWNCLLQAAGQCMPRETHEVLRLRGGIQIAKIAKMNEAVGENLTPEFWDMIEAAADAGQESCWTSDSSAREQYKE